MLKKYLVVTLVVLVLNLVFGATAFAETKEEKAAKLAEKVKANITKLGSGQAARVDVKLKDGTKLKGYVSQIDESSFVVMNERSASPVEVPYRHAKQVKGNNLHTGYKIAIGVGILFLVALIFVACCDD